MSTSTLGASSIVPEVSIREAEYPAQRHIRRRVAFRRQNVRPLPEQVLKLSAIISKTRKRRRSIRSRSRSLSSPPPRRVHPVFPRENRNSMAYVCDAMAVIVLSKLYKQGNATVKMMLEKQQLFTAYCFEEEVEDMMKEGWQGWLPQGHIRLSCLELIAKFREQVDSECKIVDSDCDCEDLVDVLDETALSLVSYLDTCRKVAHGVDAENIVFVTGNPDFSKYIADTELFYKLANFGNTDLLFQHPLGRPVHPWPICNGWDVSSGVLEPQKQIVSLTNVIWYKHLPLADEGLLLDGVGTYYTDKERFGVEDVYVCDMPAYLKLKSLANIQNDRTGRFVRVKARSGNLFVCTTEEEPLGPGWIRWPDNGNHSYLTTSPEVASLSAYRQACLPLPGDRELFLEKVVFVTGNQTCFNMLKDGVAGVFEPDLPRVFKVWNVSGEVVSDVITFLEDPVLRMPANPYMVCVYRQRCWFRGCV